MKVVQGRNGVGSMPIISPMGEKKKTSNFVWSLKIFFYLGWFVGIFVGKL